MKKFNTGLSWLDNPKVRSVLVSVILITNTLIGLIIMWTPFIYWRKKIKIIVTMIFAFFLFLQIATIFG